MAPLFAPHWRDRVWVRAFGHMPLGRCTRELGRGFAFDLCSIIAASTQGLGGEESDAPASDRGSSRALTERPARVRA